MSTYDEEYMEQFEDGDIQDIIKIPAADQIKEMTLEGFDQWLRTDIYYVIHPYYEKESLLLVYKEIEAYRDVGMYQTYILRLLKIYFNNTGAKQATRAHKLFRGASKNRGTII